MEHIKIQIIIGSTREGRFSDKPARYMHTELVKREGVEAELIDLRDWPLPFFDQSMTPSYKTAPYPHEIVERWAAKVGEADGYIIVAPEYNHGYPAVLKNALDWVYKEWNHKPVGFVSWGSVGGARAVEQLQQGVNELSMVAIRPAIHIPWELLVAVKEDEKAFAPMGERTAGFLDELLKLAGVLKPLRP